MGRRERQESSGRGERKKGNKMIIKSCKEKRKREGEEEMREKLNERKEIENERG